MFTRQVAFWLGLHTTHVYTHCVMMSQSCENNISRRKKRQRNENNILEAVVTLQLLLQTGATNDVDDDGGGGDSTHTTLVLPRLLPSAIRTLPAGSGAHRTCCNTHCALRAHAHLPLRPHPIHACSYAVLHLRATYASSALTTHLLFHMDWFTLCTHIYIYFGCIVHTHLHC